MLQTRPARLPLLALALVCTLPAWARAQESVDGEETQVRWSARVRPGFELMREHPSSMQSGAEIERYGVFLDQARIEVELERGIVEAELSVELTDALRPETSAAALDKPEYVRDAYLGARFDKAVRLRAGHFKRPFSALELMSNGELPMRGRGLTNSLIVEEARFGGRALGLMLWGRLPGDVAYHVALSNPDWAANAGSETLGATGSARLEWKPVSELTLGVDYGHQLKVRDDGDDQDVGAGLDAQLELRGLVVVFDARLAQVPPTPSSPTPLAYGLVAYGTYDIELARGVALQPMLLAEYVDADTDFSRDEAVRGVVGVNLVLADGLRVMPQVELVRSLRTATAESPWTNSERYYVMLSAQL